MTQKSTTSEKQEGLCEEEEYLWNEAYEYGEPWWLE